MSRVLRNAVVLDDAAHVAPRSRPRRISDLVGDTFSEAYDRGKRDGAAAGNRATDEAVAALGRAIEAAVQGALVELRGLQNERIAFLIAEATSIAEFVVGGEPSASAESLISRIEAALEALDDEPLVVHVAPQDVDPATRALGGNPTMSVVGDPDLRAGEARITGPWANADLTMQAAMGAAREALS